MSTCFLYETANHASCFEKEMQNVCKTISKISYSSISALARLKLEAILPFLSKSDHSQPIQFKVTWHCRKMALKC